jgi:lipopolysaccharide transport protein LptA/LPS export ABC transporter protein LptC
VRDDDSTAGPRAAPHDLVIADATERQRAFRRARVNSLFVRTMRVFLPVAALGLLSTYAIFMHHKIRIETGDVIGTLDTGTVTGASLENFTMTSPSYQGYNAKNGSRYHVQAERALTDLSRDKPIELIGINGTLQQADGRTTKIDAAKGVFDQKNRTLKLIGGIAVAATNDVDVRLHSALVDAATARITSKEPVKVTMPDGGISSNAIEIDQKERKIFFTDGVKANLVPRPGQKLQQPEQKEADTGLAPLGASREPIAITSTRLEVSDADRTARFEGDVRADQSGRTLIAPELTITLATGARVPGLAPVKRSAGAAAQDTNSGVEKIVALKGVHLSDRNGEVRAGRAEFLVTRNEAHLTDTVEIKAAAGGTVTADTAVIETATSRIVMTGDVMAQQNATLLRGTRLVYERDAARLRLTAPAEPGAAAGRIFARLTPTNARPGRRRPAATSSSSRLAFTTNPDAPVEITATGLDVTDSNTTARFTGGVRARQSSFLLTAPTLIARYTGRIGLDGTSPPGTSVALATIRAAGPVEITSANDVAATGDRAFYDARAEKVTLTGNVVLRQGRQIVRGETLTVDLKTGRARVENAGRGKTTAKPLQHGPAPKITANRNQRDCGGRMCAVFYPSDFDRQRAKPKSRSTPPPSKPAISDDWSTSTRTN